jgi:hypothetical protein
MIYYCVNNEDYAKKIKCRFPHTICYEDDFLELKNAKRNNWSK